MYPPLLDSHKPGTMAGVERYNGAILIRHSSGAIEMSKAGLVERRSTYDAT
jgi:hypothetical protein